jgi:hypothetical protein
VIAVVIEDAVFLQNIADRIVSVVVRNVSEAGSEGACRLGKAVQVVVFKVPAAGPQGVVNAA